jgi:hypothetical protein
MTPTPLPSSLHIHGSSSSPIHITPTALPSPTPVPTFCNFKPLDVVIVLSRSGLTGAATFNAFRNIAVQFANLVDGPNVR